MATTEKDFRVKNGLIVADNATIGGDATITGNLTVNGTTTTLNTSTLDVEDLNITVAKGAATSAAADGAGLTIDGANATLTYVDSTGYLTSNIPISATYFYGDGSNLTGVSSYSDSDVISLLSSYGSNTISTTGTITTTGNVVASGRVATDEVSAHGIGSNVDLTLRGGTASNGIHIQFYDGAWVDALSIREGTHDIVAAYPTSVTDTTAATSTSTGAVVVSGGVGVAGNVHAAQFHGDGSNLTNLPASGDPAGTGVAMAIALG